MEPVEVYSIYNEMEGCVYYKFDAYEQMDVFEDFLGKNFRGVQLPENWQLPNHNLECKDGHLNDFLDGYFQAPYVSSRARRVLEPLIHDEAEFRPIGQILGRDYYVMNVIKMVDCLDLCKSDITWFSGGRVGLIPKAAFLVEKLRGVTMFKIPEDTSRVYVTQPFVRLVRKYRLTGVGFERAEDLGLATPHKAFPDLPYLNLTRQP